jgi:hypothetical protein
VTSFGEKFDARTDVVERNDSLGAPPILLVQVVMDLYPVIAGALRLVKQSMKRIFTIVVISVGVMAAAALLYGHIMFPYGDRGAVQPSMYFSLRNFADKHDGYFPANAADSLGALRQLYPEFTPSGIELAGLSGDIESTVASLRGGLPLTEAISSWIYVSGLHRDDPPDTAILWESRFGLYRNGKRNGFEGRSVLFISGAISNIARQDWDSFLKQQSYLSNAYRVNRSGR